MKHLNLKVVASVILLVLAASFIFLRSDLFEELYNEYRWDMVFPNRENPYRGDNR